MEQEVDQSRSSATEAHGRTGRWVVVQKREMLIERGMLANLKLQACKRIGGLQQITSPETR